MHGETIVVVVSLNPAGLGHLPAVAGALHGREQLSPRGWRCESRDGSQHAAPRLPREAVEGGKGSTRYAWTSRGSRSLQPWGGIEYVQQPVGLLRQWQAYITIYLVFE